MYVLKKENVPRNFTNLRFEFAGGQRLRTV